MINLSTYLNPIQQRFDAMEKRERHMVIAAFIIIVISLFYALLWDPIFTNLDEQKLRYQSQGQLLAWMKQQNQHITVLRASGAQSTQRFKNQSTSSLVERSAQSMGINTFIKKQTADKKEVKIELEQVNFDQMLLWLNDLQQKYAIQASSVKIERQERPGAVNARISLERESE